MAAEEVNAGEGADGGADPEGAVDQQIDSPADLAGDEFVDGGVDGGVLAPDVEAGDEAEDGEGDEVPGERRGQGGEGVGGEGDKEEFFAAEAVGEVAEEDGTYDGAGEVGGSAGAVTWGSVRPRPALSSRMPAREPARVTWRPSSIQEVPRAMMMRVCQPDQGRRSMRAGTSVLRCGWRLRWDRSGVLTEACAVQGCGILKVRRCSLAGYCL